MSHRRDAHRSAAIVWIATEEASMCFAHSGTPSDALHVQAGVSAEATAAFTALAEADGLGSVDVVDWPTCSRRATTSRAGRGPT